MRTADRIVIGWVDPGHVDGRFAADIARLYAERRDRIAGIARVEGGVVARQRTERVATFLNTDATWLLMLDSDEHIDVAAFDKLVDAAHDRDRPIVAGVYFGAYPAQPGKLYPHPVPLIYQIGDDGWFAPIERYPADTVIQIAAAGGGCLLMHRTALEQLRERAPEDAGDRWCWFSDGPQSGRWLSEDLTFSLRLAEASIPMHAHTGVQLGHRKRYWLTEAHHLEEMRTP